ncbi:unnamed protein product [Rangifer tarandus platyrhynchus]|uniref:Uncharacterized protein n=1 Tax=Rangifer tarandus platyrhynchus TaxID=3082113 RepID=A0ABN8Y1D9_RANTA|nr:unnamed protein product [Rangifer tarandus platyrhynchus]
MLTAAEKGGSEKRTQCPDEPELSNASFFDIPDHTRAWDWASDWSEDKNEGKRGHSERDRRKRPLGDVTSSCTLVHTHERKNPGHITPTEAAVLKSCGRSGRLHPCGSSVHRALWPQALGDPVVPLPRYLRAKPRHRDQWNPKASDERGQENDEQTEAQRSKQLARYTANASQSQDANAGPSVQTLPVPLRDPAGEKRRNKHSDLTPFLTVGPASVSATEARGHRSLMQHPAYCIHTGQPSGGVTEVTQGLITPTAKIHSRRPPASLYKGRMAHMPPPQAGPAASCLSFLPHSRSGPCPAPITCRNLMWPSLVKAGHWEWLS